MSKSAIYSERVTMRVRPEFHPVIVGILPKDEKEPRVWRYLPFCVVCGHDRHAVTTSSGQQTVCSCPVCNCGRDE